MEILVLSAISEAAPLLQPTRYKIIMALKQARAPLYIDAIAKEVNENHRLVSFHLVMMQKDGFLTSEVGEIKKPNSPSGRAGRFYKLTPKVDEVLYKLRRELPSTP